jgi:hypothetical protein
MTHRTLFAFLNMTFVVLSPLITAFIWFQTSPLHLFFTYLILLVPLFFAIDAMFHVSEIGRQRSWITF